MRPAILVIDMIYEFVHGRLKSPDAESIVPNIKKILFKAREANVPIIYLCDKHYPFDHELKIWGKHALYDSPENKIIDELKPGDKDIVLHKRNYSGFRDTGLLNVLHDLGVDTVILTGIHTHICVFHTAWDAFYYGFNIIVVRDAVAAFSRDDHKYALNYMEKIYGAKILGSEEVIGLLEKLHKNEL